MVLVVVDQEEIQEVLVVQHQDQLHTQELLEQHQHRVGGVMLVEQQHHPTIMLVQVVAVLVVLVEMLVLTPSTVEMVVLVFNFPQHLETQHQLWVLLDQQVLQQMDMISLANIGLLVVVEDMVITIVALAEQVVEEIVVLLALLVFLL